MNYLFSSPSHRFIYEVNNSPDERFTVKKELCKDCTIFASVKLWTLQKPSKQDMRSTLSKHAYQKHLDLSMTVVDFLLFVCSKILEPQLKQKSVKSVLSIFQNNNSTRGPKIIVFILFSLSRILPYAVNNNCYINFHISQKIKLRPLLTNSGFINLRGFMMFWLSSVVDDQQRSVCLEQKQLPFSTDIFSSPG